MSLIRIRDPDALRPLHVVLICIVTATLMGGFLFLSAAESLTLVDGAVEWRVDSPLRAIVQLLCLNYSFPTIYAGAIKVYLLGLGSGLAVLVLSVAFIARSRDDDDDACDVAGEASTTSSPAQPGPDSSSNSAQPSGLPLTTAQIVALLYLLWSFASSRWSAAPPLSVGGSVLLAIYLIWSFALGRGLSPAAARVCTRVVVLVTTLTACVAIWYFHGRNPVLRSKFPFGNPNFLAACLIPGIILAFVLICEKTIRAVSQRSVRQIAIIVASAIAMCAGLWAVTLSESRGPIIGLAIGFTAALFLALRGRWKLIPTMAAVAVVIGGLFYYVSIRNVPEVAARSSTIRFRLYAWRYAWEMIKQKPFQGHGQGGFVLGGDSFVADDVLHDPLVLTARIAHAHNEWLEVFVDLGIVGFALIVSVVVLTLRKAWLVLRCRPPPPMRWVLIGLMSALVGLCVEESFSVGLRVSGVGTVFYTVLGLLWAISHDSYAPVHVFSATKSRRTLTGVVGCMAGFAILVTVQQDFLSARLAYLAEQAVQDARFDEAVKYAKLARSRLNPQRALTNMYRLAETHMLAARQLQGRAMERETRARESDLVDRNILALADQDRRRSDAQSIEGSVALKELVSWSPSFLNHGLIEYWFNLILADNAAARGDREAEALALGNAAVAIKREMRRQPFQPLFAIEYLNIARPSITLVEAIDVLARPLRHNSMATPYVQVLAGLASHPSFDKEFSRILDQALESARTITASGPVPLPLETWGPEVLRLAAVIHFRRGDYADARHALVLATSAYDKLAATAPIGAASCYKELADCQFLSKPDCPAPAIASGEHALSLTPESLVGRRLGNSIRNRMVDYRLAAGQEEEARRLLVLTGVADGVLSTELGLRYRDLCDTLLQRRLGLVLRKAPNELVPELKRWLDRAIELAPNDPVAHFLAADLAFHTGDYFTTTAQLKRALELGLSVETAVRFLQVAREKKPDHPALEALWKMLTGDGHRQSTAPFDMRTPRTSP